MNNNEEEKKALSLHSLNKYSLSISMVVENLEKNNFTNEELVEEMEKSLKRLQQKWDFYKNTYLG